MFVIVARKKDTKNIWKKQNIKQDMEKRFGSVMIVLEGDLELGFINVLYGHIRHRCHI